MKKKITLFCLFLCIVTLIFANSQELYQKGIEFQAEEKWYSAIEYYQYALKENPSYNLVYQGLAECFYALNEYDQALEFVEKARSFRRDEPELKNLHGFILIGLKNTKDAKVLFNSVLQKYPNNAEARFGLAEIEVSQGKLFVASDMYKQALQRQGENRKALLSLALISYESGNKKLAQHYINKALEFHGDNYQVHYFAAYLAALSGDLESAEGRLYSSLKLKDSNDASYALLASILYSQKRYDDSRKICDIRIVKNRELSDAWYLKTLCLLKQNMFNKAIISAKVGLSIDPENEVMRSLLEEIVIDHLDFEDKSRKELSEYHAKRAEGFFRRNITAKALYEYRRALKVYPYSVKSREAYASILLRLGYPQKYFEQMSFIQTISKSNKRVNDAVEAYNKILLNSIQSKWNIDPLYFDSSHISIGLFYETENAGVLHPEAERIVQKMMSDSLEYNSIFKINSHLSKSANYKEAFKISREAGDDYFGIIKLKENDRDIQINLELFVARTGSLAKEFVVYRSGNDRFANAIRRLTKMLTQSMPVIGKVINRYQNEAIVDIGVHYFELLDIKVENHLPNMKNIKIAVIKKDNIRIKKDGLGFEYPSQALLGYFEPKKCDESLSEGRLVRNGYYDRMNTGDDIIFIFNKADKENNDDLTFGEQTSFLLSLIRKIR